MRPLERLIKILRENETWMTCFELSELTGIDKEYVSSRLISYMRRTGNLTKDNKGTHNNNHRKVIRYKYGRGESEKLISSLDKLLTLLKSEDRWFLGKDLVERTGIARRLVYETLLKEFKKNDDLKRDYKGTHGNSNRKLIRYKWGEGESEERVTRLEMILDVIKDEGWLTIKDIENLTGLSHGLIDATIKNRNEVIKARSSIVGKHNQFLNMYKVNDGVDIPMPKPKIKKTSKSRVKNQILTAIIKNSCWMTIPGISAMTQYSLSDVAEVVEDLIDTRKDFEVFENYTINSEGEDVTAYRLRKNNYVKTSKDKISWNKAIKMMKL